MTIKIHYCAIQHIVKSFQTGERLNLPQRQMIQDFRLAQLQQYQPDIQIATLPDGKPIAENHSNLVFNHSHSNNYYALAISQTVQQLGVDIEDFSRQPRMEELAQHYFHVEEYQTWQSLDYCREFWFKVWTIKEAVLKAHGMGIRLQLNSLNTQAHPTWDFGIVEHELLGQFVYQCVRLPQSMLTVAYRKDDLKSVVLEWG